MPFIYPRTGSTYYLNAPTVEKKKKKREQGVPSPLSYCLVPANYLPINIIPTQAPSIATSLTWSHSCQKGTEKRRRKMKFSSSTRLWCTVTPRGRED